MIYENVEITDSIFTKVINGINFICGSYNFGRALENGDAIKSVSVNENTTWSIQDCICSIYTAETRSQYVYEKIDSGVKIQDKIESSNLHYNIATVYGTNNQIICRITGTGASLPYRYPFIIINTFDNKPVLLSNGFAISENVISQGKATILSYRFGDASNYTCFSAVASNITPSVSGVNVVSDGWYDLYSTATVENPDTDPYVNGGGASGGGGGTGDFDGTSDTIGLPSLPSLSGLNTGFFTAFVPSASQMQSVSNYLWNNALTDILDPDTGFGEKVDALKKIVANPYDAIMGCSIIPVTPPTAGSKELKMYGILETGISLPYASTRWVQVDCGTLNIHEFWGSYLDYSPYTKTTSLYLPYIGTVSIDIDLIMAKSLQVVYYVDILSGICVAFILVDGSVKFHYQGQCSTQVPITNADYSSVISAGIGLIGNASQVVGSAVTGGAGGGIGGAVAGAVSGAISQAPAVASNVMSAKPDIRSGGAIGSSAGILSVQRPYLIIERPKQSVPAFQNHFTGYPSNITAKVSDLTGYTEFESINLDGIALTDAEKAELDNILKGGVYL